MKLSFLFEDVEDVVVPAVFADQIVPSGGRLGGLCIGLLRRTMRRAERRDAPLSIAQGTAVREAIVDRERVAERSNLDGQSLR